MLKYNSELVKRKPVLRRNVAAVVTTCAQCQNPFVPKAGSRLICSDECRMLRSRAVVKAQYQKRKPILKSRTCDGCRETYTPVRCNNRFCSTCQSDGTSKTIIRRQNAAMFRRDNEGFVLDADEFYESDEPRPGREALAKLFVHFDWLHMQRTKPADMVFRVPLKGIRR